MHCLYRFVLGTGDITDECEKPTRIKVPLYTNLVIILPCVIENLLSSQFRCDICPIFISFS